MNNRKQCILVLENDPQWAKYTKNALEEDGHYVVIASSPCRAIDKAKTISFDMLVLDLGLDRDNKRAAEIAYYEIKKIIQDIKLIVMSGTEKLINELKPFIDKESIGFTRKKGNWKNKLRDFTRLSGTYLPEIDCGRPSGTVGINSSEIKKLIRECILPIVIIFSLIILSVFLPLPFIKFFCSMSTVVLSAEIIYVIHKNYKKGKSEYGRNNSISKT